MLLLKKLSALVREMKAIQVAGEGKAVPDEIAACYPIRLRAFH